jgi:hypothetical protein
MRQAVRGIRKAFAGALLPAERSASAG